MGLVYYSSDSDSDSAGTVDIVPARKRPRLEETTTTATTPASRAEPTPKPKSKPNARRALPKLPAAYSGPADNPADHQGKRRARPFVDGDYYAHVYIELPVPAKLRAALDDLLDAAGQALPDKTIHSLLTSENGTRGNEASKSKLPLHISLTHPLPLRRDQVAKFPVELAARLRSGNTTSTSPGAGAVPAASTRTTRRPNTTSIPSTKTPGFKLSLASLAAYTNTANRAFLALRVGAGGPDLLRMLDGAVAPLIEQWHLPAYHADPEFHASFAWCLLDEEGGRGVGGADKGDNSSPEGDRQYGEGDEVGKVEEGDPCSKAQPARGDRADQTASPVHPSSPKDPARPPQPFSPVLLESLSRDFAARLLATQPVGGWGVSEVCVRIAKDVTRIEL